jgi:hypothetical protein
MTHCHLPSLRLQSCGRSIAVATATVLTSCYDYLPPPSGASVHGSEVRAALTDAGSVQLATAIGPRVTSLDGQVERADGDTLVLHVTSMTLANGAESGWGGERVAIPTPLIASLRERQLNRSRTVLAAVVGTGAVVAAWLTQHVGSTPRGPVVIGSPPVGQ